MPFHKVQGTIASITLTPDSPKLLSNGLSYYLAGITYNFEVHVVDPDVTAWTQLGLVQLTILTGSTTIILQITPAGTGTDLPVTVSSGTVNAVADITGTRNNYYVKFKVTFRWDSQEAAPSTRTMQASAVTTYPAANTATATATLSYGICSTMKIVSFTADGVAADGMVNPYHDGFNITGIPVYNVTGATSSDAIETVDPGEITGTVLYLNGVATTFTDSTPADLSYGVTTGTVSTLGTNTFRVRANMNTAGGPEYSTNTLVLDCDEVRVVSMAFVNGGGIDIPPYYRSVSVPGTEIVVYARMRNSGLSMVGNTTIRIHNTIDNSWTDVLIPNGEDHASASVSFPSGTGYPATDPGITQNTYLAGAITGGSYGGDVTNGQNSSALITQPASVTVFWDRNCYPWYTNTPFTTWGSVSSTAYSVTFNWTGAALSDPDRDFSSYRIYYKESSASVFQMIDKTTSGYANLGTSTTSTATITGLIPLTNYNYYITAIDIFGNEVPTDHALPYAFTVPTYPSVATLASTITVSISDGITTYENNSFTIPPNVDNPADRSLRKTAIRVKVFIVAAGDLPDIVNLIVANAGYTPLVTSGIVNGTLNTDYYRITTLKTGANEWTGYIPDTNPLMAVGNSVEFIIETIKSSVASYADNDSETETPPGNPNDYPFTFAITSQPAFTPWPTRVLNNVITDKNPRAYPAYYLTDDAYVTITVYDIKGRVVKTLLDKAYRSGGQNIKEDGWQGDNKSNRKVGVGLYYIHFKAERTTDGKVILDSFQKVVMSR